ncbi:MULTISPECIES: ABC transporter substrate-binding protein [Luteimonas]|uniref:ABC transporter substrate-binding protein n=1 Tax=Luteimonas TaxID=83614 RepID=UPI000C7DBCE1|nr:MULTISPECIES: ABC transporter substrate-binding protein [Luteimonas]
MFQGTTLVAATTPEAEETTLAFRAATAGDYTVAVSGDSAAAYGPYTLQAQALAAYDGQALVAGSDVVDWLTRARQDYTLQADKAGLYTLTLASTAFDTVLDVRGPGVDANNDDGGDGTDSRLRLYLEPGTYTLTASALEGKPGAGDFALGVRFADVPGGLVRTDGTALTSGQTVHGELGGSGARRFVLDVAAASTVHLDARSGDVDTVLRVTGPGGSFEDDDGGSGTNARMALSLSPGRYEVVVSALDDSPGMFELETRIEGADAPPVADAAAVVGAG